YDTVLAELTHALRRELDYRAEAASAAAFARCFAGNDDIVIPAVHAEKSTDRVLVLGFIDGVRLTDYLDDCEQRGEAGARQRDRILGIVLESFCEQVLVHGIFHADPHPGNFLVVEGQHGPRLAILDFGNVETFAAERRRAYAELGLAILTHNGARMAELLETLGFRSRSGDGTSLATFAEMLLEPFQAGGDPFNIDARARFEQVLELTRLNPIVQIPGDFVALGRVFASLGGLLMRYRPNLDLAQVIAAALGKAVKR
ncbi:MAG TPA: AarF/UbiB family protein, partial [Terriglobales bacterium]|nr:AarF/UbiB family protein [Terriglobales bacterium]